MCSRDRRALAQTLKWDHRLCRRFHVTHPSVPCAWCRDIPRSIVDVGGEGDIALAVRGKHASVSGKRADWGRIVVQCKEARYGKSKIVRHDEPPQGRIRTLRSCVSVRPV